MTTLILQKRGYISTNRWNYDEKSDFGHYEIKILKTKNILNFLNYDIEKLAEGYTLRDWFHMILNYSDLQKIDDYFESYLGEFRQCPKSNCLMEDMPYLSLKKIINIINNKEMDIFISLSGEQKDSNLGWGLDFLPLKGYLDTPLILKKAGVSEESDKTEERTKNQEFSITYNLWDIVQSIIHEISFYGMPERRDLKSKELNQRTKEINHKN